MENAGQRPRVRRGEQMEGWDDNGKECQGGPACR